MYLVDYSVYGRYLAGLSGFREAFDFINKNVPNIVSLDTIYIDSTDYAYRVISEYGVEVGEVFMRLMNVLRSMVDSTVSRLISHSSLVEEAMHVSSEHGIEPRKALYYVAARKEGFTLVTMFDDIRDLDGVLYIEYEL